MRAYAVFHLLGWVLAALAAAMLFTAAFAISQDSLVAIQAFVAPAFLVGFLGGCLILAFKNSAVFSTRWDSLFLLGLIWLVVPIAAALPFYYAGFPKSAIAGYFEATSGFTTTGATTIVDLSQTPRSIIIWRAVLQWGGGLTTLLSLVAILGPLSGSHLLDRQLRVIGRSTHGSVRHMLEALRSIAPLYSALTMACFVALVFSGIPPFDAFCLALSTISTGGFMPREGTIALYGSPAAELFLTFFMCTGAVSIVWFRALLQRRWTLARETREPFWIIGLIVFSGIFLCVQLLANSVSLEWREALHFLTIGLATAASIVTTTGFFISDDAQNLIPFMILLGLSFIGAGRFSTAGGLKMYRVLSMIRQAGRELRILIYPHGVRPARHGEEARDIEIIRAIWITFASYILVLGSLAILLSAFGLGFQGAMLAGAGALGNIGPVYEMARTANFANAPSYDAMSATTQLTLCLGMIFGRVEVLALLTFLNLANWRD